MQHAFCIASFVFCFSTPSVRSQEPARIAPVPLQPGSPIHREISGKTVDRYSIALTPGQCANLVVEHHGIDVVVQVVDGQSKVLADFDADLRRDGQEDVGVTSDAAETYEIRVKPRYTRAAAGTYEIRAAEIRPATDRDRALFKAHRLSTEATAARDAGKFDDAVARVSEALAELEKSVGPDDAYVGLLNTQLSRQRWGKGDMAMAKVAAERGIEITRQHLGPNDPQTAWAIDSLAIIYRSTDEGAKAEELIKQAIDITQRSLGDDHPKLVEYRAQLGWQYGHRGDYVDAIVELQRAVAIADKSLEPEDFWSIAVRHNLGDLYLNQDDLDHAEPLTEQALAALEKKYGPDHPNVAIPLQNLGAIARERRQYARALELLERAEKINEKALGPQNPQTAGLFINIGNVYKDEGHYDKAEELFARALSALEVSAGPYHRLTLEALDSMQAVSAAEGKSGANAPIQRESE